MLKPGDKVPDFKLESDTGVTLGPSAFKGKTLILFFYPKDNTSGCTTEALEFQERLSRFRALNAEVVGISKDSLASHARYRQKHGFTFPLLSDPDHSVHSAFGAWGVKKLYGKESEGTLRTTVVVGPDSRIERVYGKVKAAGHAEAVLMDLGKGK